MQDLQGTPSNEEQPVNTQEVSNEEIAPQEPEFKLTDEGIEGDFSDWGLSEEGEQPEEKAENPQEEQEQKYYTKEEMEQLGLEKLDPNKIPPELVPFYKSMQADYTRKTQALAQERKLIENLLDNALSNPAIAQQLMNDPNFIQTAQQHPELAQKLQAVSQMTQPQNPIDVITEQAKQFVEQQLGEEFDELNPKHIVALNLATQELLQSQQRQMIIQQKLAEIQSSEPHFAEIDRMAEEKLMQMPYAEAMKIQQALQNGDMDTVLNFWNEVRKEFYNSRLNNQSGQPQNAPEPPKVEGAGQGNVETKQNIDVSQIGNLDEDAQAQMLIKMGLV
ncbi:MAG: hypothetical protein D6831_02970 [Aquificota bacterium]|nr:MAG: hypothetical protein D6831_02970 [Aquificota bacterium]